MFRNLNLWLPSYFEHKAKLESKQKKNNDIIHIMFSLVDHFEPKRGIAFKEKQEERVAAWVEKYPKIALRHRDSDGYMPRHTFFYPEEEYEPDHLAKLGKLCQGAFAEVEVHIHHDNDTHDGLTAKLERFKARLLSHGLLSTDPKGNVRYGFIHGNWALDNSRLDGRWCGVNNELEVLNNTGCYADFTLPSAPSETQTLKINSIYYAKDTPKKKSHNTGVDVEVGKEPSGDLMIIQGPLTLNWQNKKFGILPRIENGSIDYNNPPSALRIKLWVDQKINVHKKPDWIFVKVYTHGTKDENIGEIFFKKLDWMYEYFEKTYNDGKTYALHYVTPREMYNIIKAAESGKSGNPGDYRDFILKSNIKLERSPINERRKAGSRARIESATGEITPLRPPEDLDLWDIEKAA